MSATEDWPQIASNFFERGMRHARTGLPRTTKAQWVSEGWNPDTHKFYVQGYDEAFAEMTPEQRKRAAVEGAR